MTAGLRTLKGPVKGEEGETLIRKMKKRKVREKTFVGKKSYDESDAVRTDVFISVHFTLYR